MLKIITSFSFRFWLRSLFIVISIAFAHSVNAQQPLNGFPYTDSFKFPTSPGTVFGGTNGNSPTVPYSAFLTASSTAVASYGAVGGPPNGTNQLIAADENGGGYLRLTRTVTNQTGFARNTRTFPTSQGLSISFEYYTYGNLADGIVFVLYDADVSSRSAASNTALGYPVSNDGGFEIGQFGGSIGYAQRDDGTNGTAGLSKGFLGIALDEFGNFGIGGGAQGRQGGYSGGRVPQWVTLRGDGDGAGASQPGFGAGTNYEYLIGVNTASATAMASKGGVFDITSVAPASRTAGFSTGDTGYRKARIVIEYISASQFRVNVYIDENSGAGLVTHHVIENYIYNSTAPAPANLSYGFSSSTGGSTNVHEIRAIDIAAPLSVAFTPVATSATVSTLEDNAVSLSLADYAYDQNGNTQLNWGTGLDLDPTTGGVQASRTIPGQGTFTSNASGTVTFTPVANYNGTVTTDYTIADFGNASPTIAVATSNPASLTITVTPVNDPPTTQSKIVTTNEDISYTFTAADFALTDAFDTPANALTAVQITTVPATGTLRLAGVTVTQGATITIASINAASLTYLPPSNTSASPMTSFTFKVQDDGGTANGGIDLSVASATMTIVVLPANDAPAGIDKTITTNEDVPYTFQVSDFSFTDAFDSPANGLLSLIVSPPGSGTLTIGGVPISTSTTIVAASITSLVYTPPINSSASPTTSFTFQVRDDGGTANGGVDLDPTPNTITINVVGINDAPSGTDKTVTTNEDVAYTFVASDFGFTDAFDTPPNNFLSVIVSPASSGSLTINGTIVSVSTTISPASVTAGSLVYTPVANAKGSPVATFTFQVRDDGGTANGGVDLDPTPNTISINVTSVNDAPSGADKTVTTNEDVAYTFVAADFGFTDAFDTPPNNFLSVVVSPVGSGSLTINGVPVSVSTTINAASVTAGLLVYTPVPNANGTPVTTFTFQVKDDGGTALGGLDTDASPNTISINVTAVNDLPVVADIPKAGAEDATITFTALDFTSKFTDVDGDAMTKIKVINLPANGLLKLNGVDVVAGAEILLADLPNITFVPTANFNGSTTFKWNGFDGTAYAAVDEDVNITITPVNDLPVVADIPKAGAEDATITFTALDFTSKFTDVDGDAMTKIKVINLPANGLLKLNGVDVVAGAEILLADLPNITFVPTANFNGSTTFKWNGFDGTAYAAVDEDVNITITPVNDLPVVADIPKAGAEDATITFTALDFTSKFTDVDGDAMTKIKVINLPANGLLKLNGVDVVAGAEILLADLPNITFVPTANFNGSTTFKWNGFDGTAYAAVDEDVNITITPVNDLPVVADIPKAGAEDATITFTALDFTSKFTDVDGDAMTKIKVINLPANGLLKLNGVDVVAGAEILLADLPNITFVPTANFNGSTTFKWNGFDGTAYAAVDEDVNITITPVNDLPVVADIPKAGAEDATITFTALDFTSKFTDVDGDAMTKIKVINLPANGLLKLNGVDVVAGAEILLADLPNITFVPTANFNGSTTFKWNGFDGTAYAAVDEDVNITITPVNDLPVVADIPKAGAEDATITFTALDFTSKFTDVDGDAMTKIKVINLPANGLLKLNGVDVVAGAEILLADLPNITFVPTANFNGSTTFKWNGFDGTAYAAVDEDVNITITPVNDLPVVADIPKTGLEDATITFTALDFTSKFTDADGNTLTKIKVINLPANGLLKLNGTNILIGAEIVLADLPNITFVPTADFNGTSTFKWNGYDGTAYAAVDEDINITITAVNDAPSFVKGANQDILTTAGAQLVTGWGTSLSKGPADEVAQTLTFTVTNNNNALFTTQPAINANGVLSYTPSGTAGTTTVTVVLKDSGGTANGGVDTYTTQTFTITITAPTAGNTPPVVDIIPKAGTKDTPVPFTPGDFTGKFTDGDSNPLNKIKIVTLPPSGTLKLDGVNIVAGQEIPVADLAKITFVPASGFTGGPVTFQWNGSDGTDYAVTPKDVNITISATNTSPVAVADAYSTVKGGTLTVSAPGVLNNDSDPDVNPITAFKVTDPANGTVTLNANGSFTYIHNNGTSTSDSFTYKVNDGIVDGNTVTVTITINASNTPPVIVDIPKTGIVDQPVTFTAGDFTSKFTDPNGDALNKIRIVTLPPSGTLRLNGVIITIGQEIPVADLPNITFVPPTGFSGGPISFQWNGSDGTDYASVPKNVNITIDPTSISISVTEVCIGDVPWVQYTITGQGFTPAANSATIQWKKMDGTVVRELTNQALTGQLLWPGAAVDANGIPTAWPGWNFTGGQWVQISDGLRPQMRLHISINPQTEVIVNYPPATPFCSANPNRPPVVSNITKSSTGFLPIPFTVTDFTSKYTDPDGDPLVKVKIQTLPPNGVLKLNGIPVTINQEIPVADLAKLTFEPALNWSGTTNFTWNGSDGDVYATSPANTALTVIAPSDPNAKIGLAKNLASVTPALNGTYDVKFVFTVVNFGPNGLENISIKDNIALAFGGTEVTVKTVTAFGNLKANSSFGLTNTELLLPSSRLLAGEEAKVELLINVKLLLTSGVFQNTATAEAISSLTGFKVTDVSTNGLRPDPNSTGDVSPSEITPIKLDPLPTYVPAGFSPNGDGMNDKFVVQNANGKHVSLEIYNRWGNRVYKSDDYKNDWGGEVTEGFFLGRDIPDGTYYYIIIIDKKDKYAGFITVNR
jgi:gliding motility-associated-like protein